MVFNVDVTQAAFEDAQDALAWMEQHSPKYAAEWYIGLMDAVFSLEEMPRRCGIAYESDSVDAEVRHLLYTQRRVTYRILFVILPEATDEEQGQLRVIRIRHGAQRPLTAGELMQSMED